MTSFLIGFSPLLCVMGLLLLAARRDQRESAQIARQIQLTDALAEAVGVIVAPIAERRFRKWQIVIRVPLGRPAVVARIVGVVHRSLERGGSDRYEIVLVPQEPPPAAALQRRSPGHRRGTDRGPASGPPAHPLEERRPQAIDEGRAQGEQPVDGAFDLVPAHRLHVEPRSLRVREKRRIAERRLERRAEDAQGSAGTPGGSEGRASAAWSCCATSISRRASFRASSTARGTLAARAGAGAELENDDHAPLEGMSPGGPHRRPVEAHPVKLTAFHRETDLAGSPVAGYQLDWQAEGELRQARAMLTKVPGAVPPILRAHATRRPAGRQPGRATGSLRSARW
jgi:hypothetical protein